MKKIVVAIVLLIALMCTSCVLADMSAPTPIVYNAYVSNPNGVAYTDYEGKSLGTLPFGTKIVCYYNWDDSVAFVLENENFKTSDAKLVKISDVTIEDVSNYRLGQKSEAVALDNAAIYSRPKMNDSDENAKVLISIPDETPITVQAYEQDENLGVGDSWSRWYYTSYQGVNGWIEINHFGNKKSNGSLYAIRNIPLKGKNGQTIIPMYTEIKEYYGFGGDAWGTMYVEYDGVKGYVTIDDFGSKPTAENSWLRNSFEIPFEGVDLYEQASLLSPIVVENLPVGTKFEAEYVTDYERWVGVTYEGTKGWLFVEMNPAFYGKDDVNSLIENNKRNKEQFNWDYPTTIEEVSEDYFNSIEENQKVNQGVQTIITNQELETNSISELLENTETTPIITPKTQEVENDVSTKPVEQTSNENATGFAPIAEKTQTVLTPTQLILLCVLCAFICGATIAVIIVLVNKKNK